MHLADTLIQSDLQKHMYFATNLYLYLCNSAAGLFLWRPSSWVEKKNSIKNDPAT